MSSSEDDLPTPRIGAFSLALNVHDVYELTQKEGFAPDPAGRVIFRSAAGGPAGERARERHAASSIVAAEVEQEEQVEVWERGWWENASLAELREGWRRLQAEGKMERQAALRRRARQIRKPRAVEEEEPVAEQDALAVSRLFNAGGEPGRVACAKSEHGASRRGHTGMARRGAAPQGRHVATGQRKLVAAGHIPAATTLRRLSRIQWTAAFKQQQFRPTCAHNIMLPPLAAQVVPRPAFGAAAEADAAEAARRFTTPPPKQARKRQWRPRRCRSWEDGAAVVAPFVTGHRGRDFFVLPAPATVQERQALEKQVQGVRQGWREEEGIEPPKKPRLWMFRALARRRKKPPPPEFKNPSVAFVAACKDGDTAFVQTCLMAGLPHRMRDQDGVPVLNLACRAGHRRTAALLCGHKLGTDATMRRGKDGGALGDTDTVAGRGYMALHEAAACGKLPICQMLVAAGADANATTSGGVRTTPLLLAICHNHIGVAKYLIAAGAEPSAEDARGRNALHYAARYAPHDTVKLLLQLGMSTRHTDKSGVTAVAAAAAAGRPTTAATIAKFAQCVDEDDMIDHMYGKLEIPCREQVVDKVT